MLLVGLLAAKMFGVMDHMLILMLQSGVTMQAYRQSVALVVADASAFVEGIA